MIAESEPCPTCHGTGRVPKPCELCKGIGYVTDTSRSTHGAVYMSKRCPNGCIGPLELLA